MDLKELGEVDPHSHWYYQTKLIPLRREVTQFRQEPINWMDVGSGSGFFASALADLAAGDTVVCVDPNYESESVQDAGGLSFVKAATLEQVRATSVFLFLDVVEHVQDDLAFMSEFMDHASPGALVLMTAPAFMSMWSTHDVYLEHYRRYRLSQLEELAREVGLDVVRGQYLFGSVFPVAWIVRRLRREGEEKSDLKTISEPLNAALRKLVGLEHRMTINRLMGLTAFVVARVPMVDRSSVTP